MAERTPVEIPIPGLPTPVILTHCESGAPVQARLVALTRKLAKTKINGAWWVGIGVSKSRRREEGDHHWDWAAEVGKHHNKLYFESVAIQTDDGLVVDPDAVAPSSPLDKHVLRLLTLHKDALAPLQNIELAKMDEAAKLSLLEDIQDLLKLDTDRFPE